MNAVFAHSCEINLEGRFTGVNGGSSPGELSEKNKRSYLIKEPRSIDMKYCLVTGGLSSVAKQYNNTCWTLGNVLTHSRKYLKHSASLNFSKLSFRV